MRDIPTISREIVEPILGTFDELGANVDTLLEAAGLIDAWRDQTSDVLPEAAIWGMFDRSARRLRVPTIGLMAGSRFVVRDLGDFGRELEQSLTLYRCLEHYVRTVNQYSSHARFWLESVKDGFWFHRQGIDVIDVGRGQVEQFAVQLMIRIVQLASGADWTPQRMKIQSRTDDAYREHDANCAETIDSNCRTTAIWISNNQSLQPVHRMNEAAAIHTIRRHVSESDGMSGLDIRTAAVRTGFSPRSLQRLLTEHGLTWSRLVEQVRLKRAIHLLESGGQTQIQISNELGYTDPANYSRAFRRWTGVTPTAYRRMKDRTSSSNG